MGTQKFFNALVLVAITGGVWLINLRYPHPFNENAFETLAIVTIAYIFFKIIVQWIALKRITESKTQFSIRKTISFLFLLTVIIVGLRIWIENAQALLVSYGIVAAGVTVALQDMFKNFAGGLIIITNAVYRVGDRIEINGKQGDVIDTGLLYTTLMETGNWVEGDQPTGRLTMIPNGGVLNQPVFNFTKDHNFIWDELVIPITYDSDWHQAVDEIMEVVAVESKDMNEIAQKQLKRMKMKYYITQNKLEPQMFISLTDNWISMRVRYITDARQRRQVHANLSKRVLEKINNNPNIKIASTTIDIIGMPPIKMRQ